MVTEEVLDSLVDDLVPSVYNYKDVCDGTGDEDSGPVFLLLISMPSRIVIVYA